jgi:regulator of sirC expression with transglutaminase-like and TPR domain
MPRSENTTVSLFADLVTRDDASINLPAAALAIARINYPDLEIQPQLDKLARMGGDAARFLGSATGDAAVDRLNRFVFGTLGFRGNRDNYYDPRNSFLNDVLTRKLGIPISLSLVYIEIARSCEITIEGIGFPGHFLVCDISSGSLLDPFNNGERLDEEKMARLLAAQGLDEAAWSDDYIETVSKRQMLLRMLNNLGRHYSQAGDAKRLARLEAMAESLLETEEAEPPLMIQ